MKGHPDQSRERQERWQQFTSEFMAINRRFLDQYIDLQRSLIEQQNAYLKEFASTEEAIPRLAKVVMASYLKILAFQREQGAMSVDAQALMGQMYLRFLELLKESVAGASSHGGS